MRIIAGAHRGRKLKAVAGMKTRPTSDRVKEAVFSAIEGYIMDSDILDLFGGTGSIALEALSRGAKDAVLVEQDRDAIAVIKYNVEQCGYKNQCRMIQKDALRALDELAGSKRSFDMIYIDPPYMAGLYEACLERIEKGHLLKNDGIIVLESAKNTSISLEDRVFWIEKERFYGDTKITFLKNPRDEEETE